MQLSIERIFVVFFVFFAVWKIEIKIFDKLRIFVVTVGKKFTPLIEACPIWVVHNVVLFQKTQFADPCWWVVWRGSAHLTPNNTVRNVRVRSFQLLPDVLTEASLIDFRILKWLFVLFMSLLKLNCATSLSLSFRGTCVMPTQDWWLCTYQEDHSFVVELPVPSLTRPISISYLSHTYPIPIPYPSHTCPIPVPYLSLTCPLPVWLP